MGAKELLGYVALRYVARGGATTRGVKGSYRELLRVGLPVQASGMLVALTDAFQPIFIGAVLGLQTLGQVSWAYNLVLMPILLIGAIDRVLLPSLARVQEDRGTAWPAHGQGCSTQRSHRLPGGSCRVGRPK